MTDIKDVYEKLIEIKKMSQVNSPEEAKEAIDKELASTEKFTYLAYDNTRQALNKRINDACLIPIKIFPSDNNKGYIERPKFLNPVPNIPVSIKDLHMIVDKFKLIGGLKDVHKSTIWQISKDINFKELLWERNSIVYKTDIEVPEKLINFKKTYYARAKFIGMKHNSDWSSILTFQTRALVIETPKIISPIEGTTIANKNLLIKSTQFKTIPEGDSYHNKSLWQLSESSNFSELTWEFNTSTFLTNVQVPSENLLYGRSYYLRVRYEDITGEVSLFSSSVKIIVDYKINTPEIISPKEDELLDRYSIIIKGSVFSTTPESDIELKSYAVQISKSRAFDTVLYEKRVEDDECYHEIPPTELGFEQSYYVRIKYYSEYSESDWSEIINFGTNSIKIKTPIILNPIHNQVISPRYFNITCEEFETVPKYETKHKSTIYQISKNDKFDEKLIDIATETDLINLIVVKPQLFDNDTEYWIRVKFIGEYGESNWSTPITIKTFTVNVPEIIDFVKRSKDSEGFGEDSKLNIGYLLAKFHVLDSYDKITFSEWDIAKDEEFIENKHYTISSEPLKLMIDLEDEFFEQGTIYYAKVKFKSDSYINGTESSNVYQFIIGEKNIPIIIDYDIIEEISHIHKLLVVTKENTITENFNEYNLMTTLEISAYDDFHELLTRETNLRDEYTFNLDDVTFLKGILYLRIKHLGYYFGETDWSETYELNCGNIAKPIIINHTVFYEELEELKTLVTLQSSNIDFTNNSTDVHSNTRWLITSDLEQQTIIFDSDWDINNLTSLTFDLALEEHNEIYCSVQYGTMYFGDSPLSKIEHYVIPSYIYKADIISPINNSIIDKRTITIEIEEPRIVPSKIPHKSTHWIISKDQNLTNVIWEETSTTDLLSKEIESSLLDFDEDYWITVIIETEDSESEVSQVHITTMARPTKGGLKVFINPVEILNNNPQWKLKDTEIWYDNEYQLDDLTEGNYTVVFKTIDDWRAPVEENIIIVPEEVKEVHFTYEYAMGKLLVILSPEEVITDGAQWRIVGTEDWHNSGYQIESIKEGNYEIEFKELLEWKKLTNSSITINPLITTTLNRSYDTNVGNLKITFLPEEVLIDIPSWRIVGTEDWYENNYLKEDLIEDEYEIEFKTLTKWKTQTNITVIILANETTEETITYIPNTGNLKITFLPEDIRLSCQWRIVGTEDWYNDNHLKENLVIGDYEIEFNEITNYYKPINIIVTIEALITTEEVITYIKAVGTLTVNLEPSEVLNLNPSWKLVSEQVWYDSGYKLENIPVGNYTLEYEEVNPLYWVKPINKEISITSGCNLVEIGTYTYTPTVGTLRVQLLPQVVTESTCSWRIQGTSTWYTHNQVQPDIPGGNHVIEFLSSDNELFIAPENMNVTIVNGQETLKVVKFRIIGEPTIAEENSIINSNLISIIKRDPPDYCTVTIIGAEGHVTPSNITVPYRTASVTFTIDNSLILSNLNTISGTAPNILISGNTVTAGMIVEDCNIIFNYKWLQSNNDNSSINTSLLNIKRREPIIIAPSQSDNSVINTSLQSIKRKESIKLTNQQLDFSSVTSSLISIIRKNSIVIP